MKVLIVDDHPVFREGIAALLRQSDEQTLVLHAGEPAEAMKIVDAHDDLDVVLLDLVLPGTGGLSALTQLGTTRPDLPVIVLSSSEDPYDARKALKHGALGYLPKSAGAQTLMSAIRLVLNGDLYLPPLLLDVPAPIVSRVGQDGQPIGRSRLTDRQIEVLRLLCEGQSNKAIALGLDLAEKTVKAHVTAIFKTLNVVSRTQAAAIARRAGLI